MDSFGISYFMKITFLSLLKCVSLVVRALKIKWPCTPPLVVFKFLSYFLGIFRDFKNCLNWLRG